MRERRTLWVVLAAMLAGTVVIALIARGGGAARPERLPALAAGGAAGERQAAPPGATSAALYPYPGAIEYRVQGTLPVLADRARAWSLGADGTTAGVAALARALGVTGGVTETPEAWTAGEGARALRVERTAGLPWTFGAGVVVGCAVAEPVSPGATASPSAPAGEVVRCPDVSTAVGGATAGSAGSGTNVTAQTSPPGDSVQPAPPQPAPTEPAPTEPAPGPTEPVPVPVRPVPPTRPAGLPTGQEAERLARDLFARAGLDLDGAVVRVDDGYSAWFVTVEPRVGGLATWGWAWSAGIGPNGTIESANGWLATPVRGDEYPLAGVDKGLERLKTNPWGIGPMPLGVAPAVGMPIRECPPDTPDCAQPAPVVRTVTGVRLGLVFAPLAGTQSGERILLVPAYLFDLDGGGTVPVLAVADEFLPKPEPEPVPVPAPKTGTSPASAPESTSRSSPSSPGSGAP